MISKSSDPNLPDEQYLKRHFLDLADTCYQKGIVTRTKFLSEAEQTVLLDLMKSELGVDISLDGGHAFAERKIASFNPRGVRYDTYTDSPFCMLSIHPKNDKYAEALNHRDVLGTLLAQQIERSCIGDILFLEDHEIIVFALPSMADMIIRQIDRIRHTSVEVTYADLEVLADYQPHFKEKTGSVASLRIDCLLAMVYDESRSKLSALFPAKKVFVNSRQCLRPDLLLNEGDIVSLRGFGRFRFDQVSGSSKKGRTIVKVSVFDSVLHA